MLQQDGFDIFDRLKNNISKGDICSASNRATKAASPVFAWSVNVHSALINTAVHRSVCVCVGVGGGEGEGGRGEGGDGGISFSHRHPHWPLNV